MRFLAEAIPILLLLLLLLLLLILLLVAVLFLFICSRIKKNFFWHGINMSSHQQELL